MLFIDILAHLNDKTKSIMKKFLLFTAIALLSITAANAQVKLGFGVGYAVPSGDAADFLDGGLSAHFELGYGVTERIDISILYQGDFLVGGDLDGASVGNLALGSYMLNGRYFFTDTKFKPYGSLGLGLATVGSVEVEIANGGGTVEGDSESNFALRPALGFKYGILNMNAAYLSAGKVNDASISDITLNIGLLFTFGDN
ncbi:hypothetical protein D1816_00425 [Aquimarina sp. AD10]|nr:hypothetical protein D1816_00425 [Aquimarina sp. AD10]RKM99649.1 hypothetical protein D7033_10790 [Aquimarina sp. AD10]